MFPIFDLGAIMFGDVLDIDECHNMITKLKSCKIPFQCAHGRPSVAPIVGFSKLQISKPKKRIDLSKLRN